MSSATMSPRARPAIGRGRSRAPRTAIPGVLSPIHRGDRLLVGARRRTDLARYAASAELIVLPATHYERVQPTDFDHAGRLTGAALAAARTALAATPVAEPAAT
jgi:hypothetical protein